MKSKFLLFQSLEELYYYLMVMLYALTVLFCADDFIGFEFNRMLVFFSALLMVTGILLVKNHKKEAMTYYMMTGVVLFLIVMIKILGVSAKTLYSGMLQYMTSSISRVESQDFFYAWIMALLIFAALYAVIFLLLHYKIWNLLLTVLLTVLLLLLFFWKNQGSISTAGLILFLIVMNSSEYISANRGKYYLLPFCAAAVLLPALLPIKSEPMKWTVVKEAGQYTLDQFEVMVEKWKILTGREEYLFSMAKTGYSESGFIQGTLEGTDLTRYMTVEAYAISSLYLKGSTYLNYNGKGWTRTDKDKDAKLQEIDHYINEWQQFQTYLRKADLTKEDSAKLILEHTLEVEYDELMTGSLFYPLKSSEIKGKDTDALHVLGANLASDKLLGKHSKYTVKFLEIDYEKLYEILHNNFKNKLLFENDNAMIEKYYTKLPDTVTERTKKLAETICEGADNDYEKCKRIEKFLHQYEYSKKVNNTHDTQDITDEFLFKSGKGYCTYFATAMTVLCRMQGIPARYVEGFVCVWEENSKNKIAVTGENAHAWCEVYFPELGWVTFEPTPSIYQQTHQQNYIQEKNPIIAVPTQNIHPYVKEQQNKEQAVLETENNLKNGIRIFGGISIAFLIIFIFIFILSYVIQKRNRLQNYDSMLPEERIILEVGMIKKLLTLSGQPVLDYLTAEDFIRIMLKYSNKRYDFGKMHLTFCRARYTDCHMETGSEKMFRDIRQELETEYLSHKNWIRRLKYYYSDKI